MCALLLPLSWLLGTAPNARKETTFASVACEATFESVPCEACSLNINSTLSLEKAAVEQSERISQHINEFIMRHEEDLARRTNAHEQCEQRLQIESMRGNRLQSRVNEMRADMARAAAKSAELLDRERRLLHLEMERRLEREMVTY